MKLARELTDHPVVGVLVLDLKVIFTVLDRFNIVTIGLVHVFAHHFAEDR